MLLLSAAADEPDDAREPADACAPLLLSPVWRESALDAERRGRPALPGTRRLAFCGRVTPAWRQAASERFGAACRFMISDKPMPEQRFEDYSCAVLEDAKTALKGPDTENAFYQVIVSDEAGEGGLTGLSGLLMSIRAENPRFCPQLILVGENAFQGPLPDLDGEASRAEIEALVRYSAQGRETLGWTELHGEPDRNDNLWRAGGTYLITGGHGALGILLAEDLVAHAREANLVLVSRHAPDIAAETRISALRERGARILCRRADVSRAAEVESLVNRTVREFGALTGIVHCAGVQADAFAARTTADDLRQVLECKVRGAANLDRATRQLPLESFLLFSSLAGITGNVGQSGYAAANAYLDAFAERRAELARRGERAGRTLSIAWPLWLAGGMQIDEASRESIRRERGLSPIETPAAIAALHSAWASQNSRVAVLSGDTQRLRSAFLEPARKRERLPAPSLSPPAPKSLLLTELKRLFRRAAKLNDGTIDAHERLERYGINSLMIARLNVELSEHFADLPKTIFFDYPTLSAVAEYLLAAHGPACAAWVSQRQSGLDMEASAQPRPASRSSSAATPSARLSEGRRPGDEIAIIGLSGSYPKAADLAAFWDNLLAGRDSIEEVGSDRWDLAGFYCPDREQATLQGKSYAKWGAFLEGAYDFDSAFFGIPPREALAMDPQERLFLQASWHALEDAGYTRQRLRRLHDNRVGVFAGITKTGYALHGPALWKAGHTVIPRTSFSSVANRVSYVLDLRGPSQPVDTMCSSSLVAIHQACEALKSGACELALAGGVNLYLHPSTYVELCQTQMLSSNGMCRSFGAGANGFVPGEGVGCAILKPLSAALRDGDNVMAVIRATSVMHGGRTSGYTVPSALAQEQLIRNCLDKAGLTARDISYVEAHGTGTALGDPIEFEALERVLAEDGASAGQCALGSVKSNIGHLEAAAGIASLTKVVLQLRHGTIAPTLHAATPNPDIRLEDSPFRLPQEPIAWEAGAHGGPVLAAVSSFGAGGVNAHAIIEGYSGPAANRKRPLAAAPELILISARDAGRVRATAERLLQHVDREAVELCDIAHTLRRGREQMPERLALIASSVGHLKEILQGFLGGSRDEVTSGRAPAGRDVRAELSSDPDIADLAGRWLREKKLSQLGALWVSGVTIDWELADPPDGRSLVRLPTYPFEPVRYWAPDLLAGHRPDALEEQSPQEDAWPAPAADLETVVGAALAETLGASPADIDPQVGFADHGLDSILGQRLVHRLNRQLALAMDMTVIYDHPSAARLAAHIAKLGPCVALDKSEADSSRTVMPKTPGAEKIAIIGMSGRFAGSPDLDAFWKHLSAGSCLISPATRWANGLDGGARYTGGFLDRIDRFDPLFFNISGLEAAGMDPQQRIFLEVAWHALEHAGHAGATATGARAGVYVGCYPGDYLEIPADEGDTPSLTGNMASMIPGRLSYFLNLKGPAIAIDTACSSSLVAIHQACEDLKRGATDLAVAGGVFVQCTPKLYRLATAAGMLSPKGQCHPFDQRADGFVPGEGAGAVVLKRLSEAVADGDNILGVIAGSGVAQEGATNGITAPSAEAQEQLLRALYAQAQVDPQQIQLVETHGTGTKLGDPIEFRALAGALGAGPGDSGGAPCMLGSVKATVGHTQYAAGVAGVLKVLLSLQHRQIPPQPGFESVNPAIDLANRFVVPTALQDWEPGSDGVRRAGVSSFGASGTIAHVVIEEAGDLPATGSIPAPGPHLFMLSARTQAQLRSQAQRLIAHCETHPNLCASDVSFTLLRGRRHMDCRLACVAWDLADLVMQLAAWLRGQAAPRVFTSDIRTDGVDGPAHGDAFRNQGAPTGRGEEKVAALTEAAIGFVEGGREIAADVLPGRNHRRVPLPGYPFAPIRHWRGEEANLGARAAVIHPLLHREVPSLSGRAFSSIFSGEETFFADHLVDGQPTFPAVAGLEMVRAALEEADPGGSWQLCDVEWARPLVIDRKPVEVRLTLDCSSGGRWLFELSPHLSGDDPGGIYLRGSAEPAPWVAPTIVDLDALRAECSAEAVSASAVYRALDDMRIHHGPSLRALGDIRRGPDLVVAQLEWPGQPESTSDQLTASLALMDSAIQASTALFWDERGSATNVASVPFALACWVVSAQHVRPCWAVVRREGSAHADDRAPVLHIDLCAADGRAVMRLVGYAGRPMALGRACGQGKGDLRALGAGQHELVPVWAPLTVGEEAPAPADGLSLLVFGGIPQDADRLSAAYPGATLSIVPSTADAAHELDRLHAPDEVAHICWIADRPGASDPCDIEDADSQIRPFFRFVKRLLALGFGDRSLDLKVITWNGVRIDRGQPIVPAQAALHGFVGSLTREYPHWRVRLLDLDVSEGVPADASIPSAPLIGGRVAALRKGTWLDRQLHPVRITAGLQTPYRKNGVYVIIGGAGGIGRLFTEHLIRTYEAQVVWIGRRAETPEISEWRKSLGGLGPEPLYVAADATDADALARALATVKVRHPVIHGVVHSAIVLRDRTIARMSVEDLTEAYGVKSRISANVARLFQDEPLDFALFFSSIQAFAGAAGQANYAAGCTFKDAIAQYLSAEWPCPVKVVNWGYWSDFGAVAAESYRRRMAQVGLESLDPAWAMRALDRAWATASCQITIAATLRPNVIPNAMAAGPDRVSAKAEGLGRSRSSLLAAARWQETQRDPALARLLSAQLHAIGADGPLADRDCAVIEKYRPWVDKTAELLREQGKVARDDAGTSDGVADDLRAAWDDWSAMRRRWSGTPDKEAQLALAEATLAALPEVLTGRRPATEILFPQGSLELVEGAYRGNPVADYFNGALADSVAAWARRRISEVPGGSLSILEVGAGTGSATAAVLDALDRVGDVIETYCYSDISKVFLDRGRDRWGTSCPFMRFELLDVENPAAARALAGAPYDLVIASNVLHATRRIGQSLETVASVLKEGGALILNELCRDDLFSHSTFGLLDGWWRFADSNARLSGSPVLTTENWRTALRAGGFDDVRFPEQEVHGIGQQIVVARHRCGSARSSNDFAAPLSPASPATAIEAASEQPLAPAAAEKRLRLRLRRLVAGILKVQEFELDVDSPLTRYGVDSIVVIQINEALRTIFGTISSTLVFDAQSISGLASRLIGSHRAEVLRLVEAEESETPSEPVEQMRLFPLSQGQTGLYVLQMSQPSLDSYNVPFAFRLAAAPDVEALRWAMEQTLLHHPVLGARIEEQGGVPYHRLVAGVRCDVERVDMVCSQESEVITRLRLLAKAPFDLAEGPLVRMHLVSWRTDNHTEDRHYLLFTAHHIVLDGASSQHVIADLQRFYADCVDGRTAPAPDPVAGFDAFVARERSFLDSEEAAAERGFWRDRLTGDLPVLPFLSKPSAMAGRAPSGRTIQHRTEAGIGEAVRAVAAKHRTTLPGVFLSAYMMILRQYALEDDVLVGMAMSGRTDPGFRDTVGYFVNMLPVRAEIRQSDSVADVVGQIRHTVAQALDHARYPFAALVRDLRLQRRAGLPPVFQASFAYQRFVHGGLSEHDRAGIEDRLGLIPVDGVNQEGEFPLVLEVFEERGDFKLNLKFDEAILDPDDADTLLRRFVGLLSRMADESDLTVAALAEAPAAAPADLHEEMSAATVIGTPGCIHEFFERNAEQYADRIAVKFEGQRWSYRELERRSGSIARHLQAHGAAPEQIVAICMRRSPDMITAILGVLRAGCAYLPIDPCCPDQRLEHMLHDADCRIGLTDDAGAARIGARVGTSINLDTDWEIVLAAASGPLARVVGPNNLAYVIYTSGTTGKPKGVMVEHRNLVRLMEAARPDLQLGPTDVWSMFHAFTFDVSVFEMWGALCHGGRLVLVPESTVRAADAFQELLAREGVTVLSQTPSAFYQLIEANGLAPLGLSLRVVIFAGEPLRVELLRSWIGRHGDSRPELVNMYGITETTVHSTYRRITSHDLDLRGGSRIGRPLSDVCLYLLGEDLKPVEDGETGEIYVGGPTVARGYLNDPDLTAARFLDSPFRKGMRLYRSGDLACAHPDGDLEYRGRRDRQVKIRGFRVELDDVETALLADPAVANATAEVEALPSQGNCLTAYIVPKDRAVSPDLGREIRARLARSLPTYMIPGALHVVEALPLTPNGKVDRKALPEARRCDVRDFSDAASRRRADLLLHLFADALNDDGFGPDDDFFDWGAHSLMLIQLVRRIREETGLRYEVNDLYTARTVNALARISGEAPDAGMRVDLEREAVLAEDVRPSPAAVAWPDAQHIFLTGGAGFVGRFLLAQIMERTDSRVSCLVLADTQEDARSQLFDSLKRYGLWTGACEERVTAIAGDLGKRNLGMEQATYDRLCESADAIYHVATFMNHYLDYPNMKAVNVDGMERIFRLACAAKQKPVQYISTINVFSTPQNRLSIDEDTSIDAELQFRAFGYTSTKWVAEKIAMIARDRGIPCNIIRLGLILGDTNEGRADPSQWFYRLMETCIETGVAYRDNGRLDMALTPVDFAARAILHIGRSGLTNRIFHLSNPKPMTFNAMVESYNSIAEEPIRIVDVDTFIETVRNVAEARDSHKMRQFIDLYEEEIRIKFTNSPADALAIPERPGHASGIANAKSMNFLNTDFVSPINSSRTIAWLKQQGLSFPPVDAAQARRCFEYVRRQREGGEAAAQTREISST